MSPFTMILLSQLLQKPCKHHRSFAASLTVQVYLWLTVHGATLQLINASLQLINASLYSGRNQEDQQG